MAKHASMRIDGLNSINCVTLLRPLDLDHTLDLTNRPAELTSAFDRELSAF